MNDKEKETVKDTIKELMDIINTGKFPADSEIEKRLQDITHNLIDML